MSVVSCHSEPMEGSESMSKSEIWIDNLESDGYSGATALADLDEIDWDSPMRRLKGYLESKGYSNDTAKLNLLDSTVYRDLRRNSFKRNPRGIVTPLVRSSHSMQRNSLLKYGEGYYFSKGDTRGENEFVDLGVELWKIDNSNPKDIGQMKLWWRMKYPSLLIEFSVIDDNLYVIYTRNSTAESLVQTCCEEVKGI